MARRYELTDQQFALIEDVLSQPKTTRRGRPRRDDRLMLNGIFWVLCSGAPWRDLPERFGPWQTVYDRYRRWTNDGTIDRVLDALQLRLLDEGTLDLETWFVDSTTVRASRAAAGAKKKAGS